MKAIQHDELIKLGFEDTGDPNWDCYCKKMEENIRIFVNKHRRTQKGFSLIICEGDDEEITLNTNCTIKQVQQLIQIITNK